MIWNQTSVMFHVNLQGSTMFSRGFLYIFPINLHTLTSWEGGWTQPPWIHQDDQFPVSGRTVGIFSDVYFVHVRLYFTIMWIGHDRTYFHVGHFQGKCNIWSIYHRLFLWFWFLDDTATWYIVISWRTMYVTNPSKPVAVNIYANGNSFTPLKLSFWKTSELVFYPIRFVYGYICLHLP